MYKYYNQLLPSLLGLMRALFLLTRFLAHKISCPQDFLAGQTPFLRVLMRLIWQDIFWEEDSVAERTAGCSSTAFCSVTVL